MRLTRNELSTIGAYRLIVGINNQSIKDLEKGTKKRKKDAQNYINGKWCQFLNQIKINNN